jgi:hypothetical protein
MCHFVQSETYIKMLLNYLLVAHVLYLSMTSRCDI